jgi:type VI secretion system protein ImpK
MSERAQQADDADATVVLPTPGRKRSAFAPSIERQAAVADLAALGGLNPLVEAANPILAAVPQIRHALRHADPAGLHERLKEQVDGFERSALAAGIAEDQVQTARFALCALLDDSAAATPWGRQWVSFGLLADEDAGEKFFTLLEELLGDPERNAELLEFFYVCLALGFEGQHRGGEGGRTALAQVRTRLYELIEQRQGRKSTDLSARWRGAEVRQKGVSGALTLWGVAAGCLLVLAVLYFGYSVLLGARSDPVARELARLKLPGTASAAAPKAPLKPGEVSVAAQLAKTIGGADVEVTEANDGAVILLKSDRLFAAGSSRPDSRVQPVIEKVAAALDKLPGSVIVTGHTDDQPIRTARFPSNWELSTERARNVVALMAAELKDPARLRAEGLADSEPLVPNDSAANRAKNRRVAILLRSGS